MLWAKLDLSDDILVFNKINRIVTLVTQMSKHSNVDVARSNAGVCVF